MIIINTNPKNPLLYRKRKQSKSFWRRLGLWQRLKERQKAEETKRIADANRVGG